MQYTRSFLTTVQILPFTVRRRVDILSPYILYITPPCQAPNSACLRSRVHHQGLQSGKKNPRSCNSSWRSAHHVKTGLKRLTQEPDARLSTAELDAAWSEPYGDFGRNERDIVPRKPHFSFVKFSPYLEGELTSLKMSRDAPAERHSPAIQEADTHMLRGRWRRVCSSNSPARTCLLPRPAAGQKQLVKVFEAFSVNCLPSCFLLSDRTFNARTKDITWLLCLYQKSLFCWCSM